jgi:hypothetical protein
VDPLVIDKAPVGYSATATAGRYTERNPAFKD